MILEIVAALFIFFFVLPIVAVVAVRILPVILGLAVLGGVGFLIKLLIQGNQDAIAAVALMSIYGLLYLVFKVAIPALWRKLKNRKVKTIKRKVKFDPVIND